MTQRRKARKRGKTRQRRCANTRKGGPKWNRSTRFTKHGTAGGRYLRQIAYGQLSGPLSFIPERTKEAALDYRMKRLGLTRPGR